MPLVLISDANILIDIQIGNLIKPMFKLSHRFIVPDIIFAEELETHHAYLKEMGLEIYSMDETLVERVESLSIKYPKPSRNDIFALVLAEDQKSTLLTGDKALRNAAKEEKIMVHGTLWLIKEMFYSKLISVDDADHAFSSMKALKSRLPWDKVDKLLLEFKKNTMLITA